MKNIIEVIKLNKGIILKRGLIVLGAIAGLTIAAKVLGTKANNEDEVEFTEIDSTDVDDYDSED